MNCLNCSPLEKLITTTTEDKIDTNALPKAPAREATRHDFATVTIRQLNDSQLFNDGAIAALETVLARRLDEEATRRELAILRRHQKLLADEKRSRKFPNEAKNDQPTLL